MVSPAPNIAVIESLLLKKEAGFFDFLRPSRPTFGPPPTVLGAGSGPKKTKKELRSTQKRELTLWKTWDDNGRKKQDFEPLYKSFKPLISREVGNWTRNEIPPSAIRAEVNMHFVNAMHSYDPNKGAALGSWVHNNFRKTQRFIKTYQNIGHIPEDQQRLITPYKRAKEELTAKFGHEPDVDSLAATLGVHTRRIVQLQKELRRDLPVSRFEEEGMGGDPVTNLNPKEFEAINLIKHDLTPEEKIVYEYTFGLDGKPELRPGDIAIKAKIHPSKVSRIRKKLKDKVLEAMEYV